MNPRACKFFISIFSISILYSQEIPARFSYEPANPDGPVLGKDLQKWQQVPPGLQGSFASIHKRYPQNYVPDVDNNRLWRGSAWRGERIYAQIVLWSANSLRNLQYKITALTSGNGQKIDVDDIHPRFVRFILADDGSQLCDRRQESAPVTLVGDVLDVEPTLDMPPCSIRPLWIIIDVPAAAKAGIYRGKINVQAEGNQSLDFEIELEVLSRLLPPPSEWTFHLDLWQNPFAVATYHRVKPWSEVHWQLLKPLLQMLADAGQKCVTASIVHKPWAGQTYTPFQSMIEWIKRKDGSWTYDYRVFDKWVKFAESCGISEQINCYSMVPWSNSFRYFDEATETYQYVEAAPGTKEYEAHWRPLLTDFQAHLREAGLLQKTTIAMDERPLQAMQNVIDLVKKTAPGLRITLAGGYHPEIKWDVYDLCIYLEERVKMDLIKERTDKSLPTTFYVACEPLWPNIHSFSPPGEAAWMGWYAAAQGYDGFLFWAYNSWTLDPLTDSRFVTWPAGDCFLVYPGPRSSIRFEMLRDGIEDFEKINILRKAFKGDQKRLDKLTEALGLFVFGEDNQRSYTQTLEQGQKVLLELSR